MNEILHQLGMIAEGAAPLLVLVVLVLLASRAEWRAPRWLVG